jgi:hypothetical protein
VDDEATQKEFRLLIQTPDETHPWHARLEGEGEVFNFESPLELLEWLEAQLKRPMEGLR